ncbi:trypsin-like peptidase domain-containing protein [Geitlerinema sp. PCC 9228]|jgi:serine protease Do|uniref:trypsin-like peptidase domain-containing protein n=1 Tax=Geitlerinema sp. PCC 9228 TaxID=111611 RepID=UPI0008F9E19C|nr:trypsin-like peptidase domain-containing protein [Geitlerinema sp. PCC 9228]
MSKQLIYRFATSSLLAVGMTTLPMAAATLLSPAEQRGFDLLESPALAADEEERTNIQVYEQASDAVVAIEAGNSAGSGSIISADGLVLTNAHVIEGASDNITVTLEDGRRVAAEAIAFASSEDLAILQIRGAENLPTIPLADTGSVQVGQRAFAIGNPFGQFQGTFTTGIVSRLDSQRGLIQHDAAINPGNSGGPLLNSDAELIGVNTAIFTSGQSQGNIGIGFAISVSRVQSFLASVRQGNAPRANQRSRPSQNRQEPQAIALNGRSISGQLRPGDNVLPVDNSFFDVYTFSGQQGQQVTIDMNSQEIDPYLILFDPNGVPIAQDDDSGRQANARIAVTLPRNGTYTLLANSYRSNESGQYTLQAIADGNNAPPSNSTARVILQRRGELEVGDSRLSDRSLYDTFSFSGRRGQRVQILLESPDFDTYLILVDENGEKLAENDDFRRGNTNSALRVNLPYTGSYRVLVNAYDRTGRGRYQLIIR